MPYRMTCLKCNNSGESDTKMEKCPECGAEGASNIKFEFFGEAPKEAPKTTTPLNVGSKLDTKSEAKVEKTPAPSLDVKK